MSLINVERHKTQVLEPYKVYCPTCGHSLYYSPKEVKKLCSWCGHYIFRNKKEEFKYRLKEELKKRG